MKELEQFSKIIKEYRLQYGYTQKYVAEQLGIVYQSYQAYELGLSFPSFVHFLKLAELYDASLDELVGNDIY